MSLKPKTHKLLSGEALLMEIAATQVPIRILKANSEDTGATISPEAALRLVLRATHGYEGKCRSGRVYWLRATQGKQLEINPAWWEGRSCTRFLGDQLSTPVKVRAKRVADMWDRILAMDPPSLHWKRP